MNVGVCYAEADRQLWMRLEVPDESQMPMKKVNG